MLLFCSSYFKYDVFLKKIDVVMENLEQVDQVKELEALDESDL